MKTVQKNPWKVESIQDFSCLKCPECAFFTKKENYFENHAIKKHPLSAVLFDEKMSYEKYFRETEDKVKNKVQVDVNHIDVDNIKKEPTDLDNSEYDPFGFSDTSTQQKEGNFLISSMQYDLSNLDNQPKKLKIKAIDSGKAYIDIQNQVDIVDNTKEEKEQSEMLEAQIHFIPEKKHKKLKMEPRNVDKPDKSETKRSK